jgi:hypothetical protein
LEVQVMKIILVALPAAVLGFSAGIWAEPTIVGNHPSKVVVGPAIISPLEMHRNIKPDDLPVQYMQGDYN